MSESMMEAMTQPSILHNTFAVERSYPLPPERVFAAFSDPKQKRKWLIEGYGNEVKEYSLDFRVGGNEVARYSSSNTPFPEAVFSTIANYQLIEIGKRIVMANTMSLNDHCISSALVSFEFLPTEAGTDLICTHQAAFFEGSDGPQIRERGWKTLLEKLGSVLEGA
jgi:uncharacterized protein YndB with AHSA1/START domain